MYIIKKHEGFIANYKTDSDCNGLRLGSRFTGISSLSRSSRPISPPRLLRSMSKPVPLDSDSMYRFSFQFLSLSRRPKGKEKRKEKWEREIDKADKRGTGGGNRTGSEQDGGSEWEREREREKESKIGRGIHRYPGHDDCAASIYSAAEPVRGIWSEELTHARMHASTRRGSLHRRLPDERNRHFGASSWRPLL